MVAYFHLLLLPFFVFLVCCKTHNMLLFCFKYELSFKEIKLGENTVSFLIIINIQLHCYHFTHSSSLPVDLSFYLVSFCRSICIGVSQLSFIWKCLYLAFLFQKQTCSLYIVFWSSILVGTFPSFHQRYCIIIFQFSLFLMVSAIIFITILV